MKVNPHFLRCSSWKAAQSELEFTPLHPRKTLGAELRSISIFVRDYKMRAVPRTERSLEAHYGLFVFSQQQTTPAEAKRLAMQQSYGLNGREVEIAGLPGCSFDLGPEVPPDDPDGRSPAVVVWYDGGLFYLLASDQLQVTELLSIAVSTA